MNPVPDQLQKILEEMGNSGDMVAQTLQANAILGVRNTVRVLNPVVRYVQGLLLLSNLGMDLIKTGFFRIHMLDGSLVEVPLPEAITDFLLSFNEGNFPALEMPLEKKSVSSD